VRWGEGWRDPPLAQTRRSPVAALPAAAASGGLAQAFATSITNSWVCAILDDESRYRPHHKSPHPRAPACRLLSSMVLRPPHRHLCLPSGYFTQIVPQPLSSKMAQTRIPLRLCGMKPTASSVYPLDEAAPRESDAVILPIL